MKVDEPQKRDEMFDENFFYCVGEDGTQRVILAKSEDEIDGMKLTINLFEIERIRAVLVAAKAVTPYVELSHLKS